MTVTLPLTVADAVALFVIVKEHAPAPLIRDVMHDGREIFVRVYDGKVKIYEHHLQPVAG